MAGIESLWIEVFQTNSRSILVCFLYRPPDTSKYLDESFEEKFDGMISTSVNENKETIVLGDINCDYLKRSSHPGIKSVFTSHGLKQIVKKPTRITRETSTLIDVIATSHENNVNKYITCPNSLSDHNLTGASFKKNCQKYKPRRIFMRNFAKYNGKAYMKDLADLPWDCIQNEKDTNKAWDTFKELLLSVINKHAPLIEKTVRGRECPWLNPEIKKAMIERDYHLRKARKTGREVDWSTYRRLRNDVTRKIRYSKSAYTRSIVRENISHPKQFWNIIKRCYPVKQQKEVPAKLISVNGKLTSDKKIIANGFCKFFAEIGKRIQAALPSISNPVWKNQENISMKEKVNPKNCHFKFKETSARDIYENLKSLKRKKSSGYDEIPTSLIIDGAGVLCDPLSLLINCSLRNSVFPTAEKCAKISPVFKSEERYTMDNYRPISVLPVLSKVVERVVYRQVYDYLCRNHLLSENQFGFRRGSSTEHAVTCFTDHIRICMDKGLLTGAVFIDLKKAFDTVDHARLLSKLPAYGIIGTELHWFESYLFNRKHFVVLDGVKSEEESVICGVPQGSILGPLLFSLLINDIDLQLKKSNIILYADDNVIFTSDKNSKEVAEKLNDDLKYLNDFFVENKMVVNLKKSKTEFVLFGSHQKLAKADEIEINMNNQKIVESDRYEYLGMQLDKNLNLLSQFEKMYKKVSSRIKLLARVRMNISPTTAETIYKIMILPLFLYCSNINIGISDSHKSKLEKLQNRATKIINGHNGKISLPSINHVRNKRCAIEVFKCLNGLAPRIFEKHFKRLDHQKDTRGNKSNLVVPRIRTEAARKAFSYQGVKIYNRLPPEVKNENSFVRFKKGCNDFDFSF